MATDKCDDAEMQEPDCRSAERNRVLADEDDSPLTDDEIRDLPPDLREICEAADEPPSDDD